MIALSSSRFGFRPASIVVLVCLAGLLSQNSDAAQLKQARVSQVVKDVKLLPAQAAPRPAAVSDEVRDNTAVRTGVASRAELTFTDQSLARLGANTIFSFDKGTRNLELGGGAMLLRVPKNSGGAQINTAAVTAAITGTTVMLEYHPDAYIKFIVLEGTGRVFRKDHVGESVLVHAGQMLIVNPNGTSLPEPVDVDLKRLMQTSLLITGFDRIPSLDLIQHEIATQTKEKDKGDLVNTNLVIFGGGTLVSLLDTTNTNTLDQATTSEDQSGGSRGETQPTPQPTPPYFTPTPTPSASPTATPSPTVTPTPTATVTPTVTPSPTVTPTPSVTPTPTITPTPSSTPTPTTTPTPSSTPTPTITPTPTPTITATPTPTPTITATPTPTPTVTPTATPTPTITATPTPTVTPTPTITPTPTATPTPTITPPPADGATYNGGTGNWSNPASWTPGVVPNNGNNGADYDVTFTTGTLTQDVVPGVIINQLFMSGGTLILANPLTLNFGLQFSGGSITSGILNIAGDSTQSARMTVNGTTINNSGNYRVTLASGNVFSGSGSLFNNSGVVNRSAGTGSLTFNLPLNNDGTLSVASGTLTLLSPNTLVNTGLIQANSGGILVLSGSGGGVFTNTGGTIEALDGSQVQLTGGASITGGILSTNGTGAFHVNGSQTGALTDLTNAGALIADNDAILRLSGAITNTGSIAVTSTGFQTDLEIQAGGITLDGGGIVTLANAASAINSAVGGDTRLTNVDNLIQGQGRFGQNVISITNQAAGVIDANIAGAVLTIDPVNVTDAFLNTGVLRASNGGILLLTGSGGGAFTNTGGTIEALDGSQVQLTGGASITGGTLSTAGTGAFHINGSQTGALTDLTNSGALIADNDAVLRLSGAITNTGSITVTSTGFQTDLEIQAGGVTLDGGGILTLANAASAINSAVGGDTRLTNVDNLIQGQGRFGQNVISVTNQSDGVIDANISGAIMTIDPVNVANAFVNNGVLRASNGGVLLLSGNGGGAFTNTNLIEALNGSEVQLTAGVSITGGTLSTAGNGVFRVNGSQTTFLANLTNLGVIVANNDAVLGLAGTITNIGSITVTSTGFQTDLQIQAGGATLTGGGTLTLANAASAINGVLGERLTNFDNLIQGRGSVGQNVTAFTNQLGGVIEANIDDTSLALDPVAEANVVDAGPSFQNDGILRARDGGILILSGNGGGVYTNNNLIEALDDSQVQLTSGASIIGGTLSTTGTGAFHINGSQTASLTDLTNSGALIADNDAVLRLSGAITNTGSITVTSTGFQTDLEIQAGGVTLDGGGILTLANAASAINSAVGGDTRLTNVDNLIQGQGRFGQNVISVTNQSDGVIDANISGAIMTIDPVNVANAFVNNGVLRASNGGILVFSGNGGGDFDNAGTIEAITGGSIQVTGTVTSSGTVDVGSDAMSVTGSGNYTQTAGTFRMAGGTVTSSTALNFTGGLVDARGTINAAITNGANLQPALGGAGLIVNGAVTLLTSSKLTFQLGGLTQGSQYGVLNANGTVGLNGTLVVTFAGSFQAMNNDNFTVLNSTALSGAFTNAPSGSRVAVTDGPGTFLVTYAGNNSVVLSDFEVGVPGAAPTAQKVAVSRTAAARPLTSLDDPRPVHTGIRPSRMQVKGRRAGITLQNSDQLRDLMETSGATTTKGRLVVHRIPSKRGTSDGNLPKAPSVMEERAIVQRNPASRMRPVIHPREN